MELSATPERPGAPRRPHLLARVGIAFAGICILLYGLLATFVAQVWGPGNSDELVSGGPGLIPWFGLSFGGTFAALAGLAMMLRRRRRPAARALLGAGLCLAGWTVFLYVGTA
jgi:uncharacterized BrkB/YihY/UPF0761 family membrane protein